MKYFMLVLLSILISCGKEKAKDPIPGKNASCITIKKDDKIYTRCVTGDGLLTETSFDVPKAGKDGVIGKNGMDGKNGIDAIVGSASCLLEWRTTDVAKNDLIYNIIKFQSGDELHSLVRQYSIEEYSSEKVTTVNWPESIKEKYVNDGVFKAIFRGSCLSSISMKKASGIEVKEMECKCKGDI